MEQSHLVSAAMKLHYVTELNTYILSGKGDFLFHHETISLPSFMPGYEQSDIVNLHWQMDKEESKLYHYTNEWGLNYLGQPFTMDGGYSVIIGPFLDMTPNFFSLSREFNLSSHESEELRSVCSQLQVLSLEKENGFSNLLRQFEQLADDSPPTRLQAEKSEEFKAIEKDISEMNREAELVKLRYKVEGEFMYAVELGQKEKAQKLINSNNMLFSFSDRFPNQPIRRVKNLAIVLNTLLRTAVSKSKVPSILIHRLSEKFAFEIEYTNKLSKLQQLYDQMIEEYCDLVRSSTLSDYSNVTQRAVEYLVNFYDKQIDKNELAEVCFTHPSHLSRKFKQETKMTITGYQQMLRINKAKYLLMNESISIEEIAWLVGYEDASYFTRVFKKETGYTPSKYKSLH
ncbi:helix-turn-helix domain-containing protein [Virgibacillus xinjiangensis]|uniref:Helix-turn-helix domain-containing protein n=1 Tax=Virgibacillus xinjiangensis TaxID=393090 RepID=A0ABV7CSE6_9BACI